MINHATDQFWKLLDALPQPVQELARKQFALFEEDSAHPSLIQANSGNTQQYMVGAGT